MLSNLELAHLFREKPNWITGGDDTQYCFFKKGEENILIFAPSNSGEDWKNNFHFWKRAYKDDVKFYVHSGFFKCWQLVEDEILNYINAYKFDNLTIVGWSYGGAMATLCEESIYYNFPELRKNIKCVTFGSPRVFSKLCFKNIKERFPNMTRFVNSTDIVTTLPFAIMGFTHVCKKTLIGEKRHFFNYFKVMYYHMMKYKKVYGYIPSLEKYEEKEK